MSFIEVTSWSGFGPEYYFHIDVDTGKPIHLYAMKSTINPDAFKSKDCPWVDGKNPLFVHYTGDSIVGRWNRAKQFITKQDEEDLIRLGLMPMIQPE